MGEERGAGEGKGTAESGRRGGGGRKEEKVKETGKEGRRRRGSVVRGRGGVEGETSPFRVNLKAKERRSAAAERPGEVEAMSEDKNDSSPPPMTPRLVERVAVGVCIAATSPEVAPDEEEDPPTELNESRREVEFVTVQRCGRSCASEEGLLWHSCDATGRDRFSKPA
jgi:hypothetical protein